jgi:hemerythrin-like domain-containing protein
MPTSSVPGHGPASGGFVPPLAMLSACHDLCASHIAREEAELLPMAGRLLGDVELERIGDALRRRRGLEDEASRQS